MKLYLLLENDKLFWADLKDPTLQSGVMAALKVPTDNTQITNGMHYLVPQDIEGKADKSYVDQQLAAKFSAQVVTELPPASEAKRNVIYLILKTSPDQTSNVYDEWLYTDEGWEHLGDTEVDISGKEDVSNKVAGAIPQGQGASETLYPSVNAAQLMINASITAAVGDINAALQQLVDNLAEV